MPHTQTAKVEIDKALFEALRARPTHERLAQMKKKCHFLWNQKEFLKSVLKYYSDKGHLRAKEALEVIKKEDSSCEWL